MKKLMLFQKRSLSDDDFNYVIKTIEKFRSEF